MQFAHDEPTQSLSSFPASESSGSEYSACSMTRDGSSGQNRRTHSTTATSSYGYSRKSVARQSKGGTLDRGCKGPPKGHGVLVPSHPEPTSHSLNQRGDPVRKPRPPRLKNLPLQPLNNSATPSRHKSTKELISQFESHTTNRPHLQPANSTYSPTKAKATTSSTQMLSFQTNDPRLNNPLPALPTTPRRSPQLTKPIPSISPSKSPIRTFMDMMGGFGKKKHSQSSPAPRKRVLLDEDDVDITASTTVSQSHNTPRRDSPPLRPDNEKRRQTLSKQSEDLGNLGSSILRAGPLLYAPVESLQPGLSSSPTDRTTWHYIQAALRPPTFTLTRIDEPSAAWGDFSDRNFNLRHATVESLPAVVVGPEIVAKLETQTGGDPCVTSRTVYVFEILLQTAHGVQKERFAAMSPWERGKWVCHIWDAICTANGPHSSLVASVPKSSARTSPYSNNLSVSLTLNDTSEPTYRLEPPLRVVNVSKLSAFFEADSTNPSNTVLHRASTVAAEPTLSTQRDLDALPTPPLSAAFGGFPASITATSPVKARSPHQTPRKGDRATTTRCRSVPVSPSINNLGRLTLVQQRLARLEPTVGRDNSGVGVGGLTTPPASPHKVDASIAMSHGTAAPGMVGVQSPVRRSSRNGGPAGLPSLPGRSALFSRQDTEDRARGSKSLANQQVDGLPSDTSSSAITRTLSGAPFQVMRNLPSSSPGVTNTDATPSALDLARGAGSRAQSCATMSGGTITSSSSRQTGSTGTSKTSLSLDDCRLSAISSIPDTLQDMLSPIFALVRDSALVARSTNMDLMGQLEAIKLELGELKEKSFVQTRAPDHHYGREETELSSLIPLNATNPLSASSFGDSIISHIDNALLVEVPAKLGDELGSVKGQMDDIVTILTSLNNSSQADRTDLANQLVADRMGVSHRLDAKHEDLKSKMDGDRMALEAALSGKVEEVKELLGAVERGPLAERLDWIKATLSERPSKIEPTTPPALPVPGQLSAFKNLGKAQESLPLPVDLSSVHAKLDSLISGGKSSDPQVPGQADLVDMQEKLDTVTVLCKQVLEEVEGIKMPDGISSLIEGSISEGEGQGQASGKMDLTELLSCLQEDQTHRERYYTELNTWLQNNAAQTGTQYHALATQLQLLTQALAPVTELQHSANSEQQGLPAHTNVMQDIRQALIENSQRSLTNDNYLAAANHLMGTASVERQNLAATLAVQRDEFERLLARLATSLAGEIRGEKHRFVDAMEKATSLNLEGQLGELKSQISTQFFSMAEEVDRLRDERKGLEHQIAELLTFKNRVAQDPANGPVLQRQHSSSSHLMAPASSADPRPLPPQAVALAHLPGTRLSAKPTSGTVRRPLPVPSPGPYQPR